MTNTNTPDTLIIAALAIATIAATGLLVPLPLDSGSVLAWSQVPIPILLAGGMAYYARQAHLRGEHKAASALLGAAIAAVVFIAVIASRLG